MGVTIYEKTMQRALRLLSYKARTIEEMRRRLLEKEWAEPEVVEQVMTRLAELNYLNDEDYANNFANSRLALKPLGPTRLRIDLQRKQLPAATVESAMARAYDERPEEELIESLIAKRLRLKGLPVDRDARNRLTAYLMRRGFSYDLVARKIRELGRPDEVDAAEVDEMDQDMHESDD
jgi:regulatory protein